MIMARTCPACSGEPALSPLPPGVHCISCPTLENENSGKPPTMNVRSRAPLYCMVIAECVLASSCVSVAKVRQHDAAGPAAAVDAYLGNIQRDNVAGAYQLTCETRRKSETEEQFAARVEGAKKAEGAIRSYHVMSSDILSNGRGVVGYRASTTKGIITARATLLPQGHSWCISSVVHD